MSDITRAIKLEVIGGHATNPEDILRPTVVTCFVFQGIKRPASVYLNQCAAAVGHWCRRASAGVVLFFFNGVPSADVNVNVD